ncbi:hypothetical protein HDU97_004724 [Phlyctochytrium planicorne]|nr:hypothetical protein HDU97_004724 [Phlyctochytrium planicorne]
MLDYFMPTETVEVLRQKHAKGDWLATLKLADCLKYRLGGVEYSAKNLKESHSLYSQAATKGDLAEAMTAMAMMQMTHITKKEEDEYLQPIPVEEMIRSAKAYNNMWLYLEGAVGRSYISKFWLARVVERLHNNLLDVPELHNMSSISSFFYKRVLRGLSFENIALIDNPFVNGTSGVENLKEGFPVWYDDFRIFEVDFESPEGMVRKYWVDDKHQQDLTDMVVNALYRQTMAFSKLLHDDIQRADRCFNSKDYASAANLLECALSLLSCQVQEGGTRKAFLRFWKLLARKAEAQVRHAEELRDSGKTQESIDIAKRAFSDCKRVFTVLKKTGNVLPVSEADFQMVYQMVETFEAAAKELVASGLRTLRAEMDKPAEPSATSDTQSYRSRAGRVGRKGRKESYEDTPVSVILCSELVSSKLALNAESSEDGCPICRRPWPQFTSCDFSAIPPCKHAICAECLSSYRDECQKPFSNDIADGDMTTFYCVLCRERLAEGIVESMAMQLVKSKAIESLYVLAEGLMPNFRSKNDMDELISALLVSNFFQISQVEGILFNMLGLVTSDDPDKVLQTADKQEIYKNARAPVKILEAEYKQTKDILEGAARASSEKYRLAAARIGPLTSELNAARMNAARDIFERTNASGGMGSLSNNRREISVDLHGLHVGEAKEMLQQFVLPVVPVMKSVVLITGRGKHSVGGDAVLKKAMKEYLQELGLSGKEVLGNPGALRIEVSK